jgi:phenylacetate-coenzyme A ligase PaaK-like adenylate-forming protein
MLLFLQILMSINMNHYPEILKEETQSIQKLVPQLSTTVLLSREKIFSAQEKALRDLLIYAKNNSPYYTKKLAAIDMNHFVLADLKNIEPLTKRELMAHWDEIVTDPDLKLAAAGDFLMNQSAPALFKNKYHVTATGGSSGLRGVFAWSQEEFTYFVAAFFRYQYRDEFSKLAPNARLLVAAITAEKPVHLSRFVFTVPLVPQMDYMLLPATMPISRMIEELNKGQPTHLIGYTTELHRLAQEALRGKLNIKPQRISVNSEPLFPDMLATIKAAWNVPVTNMWGSSDAGPHAESCDYSQHLHLNEDLMIVEPVDVDNQPIPSGGNPPIFN